jgi:hypothetical protein
MADQDLLPGLQEAGEVIGKLASDEGAFERALKAFQKQDIEAYRSALDSVALLVRCEKLCCWFCVWHCIRVCRIICRELPPQEPTVPDLREFALGLAGLTANESAPKRLLDAIEGEDTKAFHSVVAEFKLERFCYLLCYWVCFVRCRLFCHLICSPADSRPGLDALGELREAGDAVGKLAQDEQVFTRAIEAAQRHDLESLRRALGSADVLVHCIPICFWLCSVNCFRVCWILCRPIPTGELSTPELRDLAFGLSRLGADQSALKRLIEAFDREDAKLFGEVVGPLGLGRFCYFVCRWFCCYHCDLFCILLCPPSCLAVFRYIGGYNYLTQIDSGPAGNGLTIPDLRAFFLSLRLNGIICKKINGQPAEYRFEVKAFPAGPWLPVVPSQIDATKIGVWEHATGNPINPIETKDYVVNGAPGPNVLVVFPAADGWIKVPQESNVNGPEGSFIPNGDLIRLNSRALVSWPDIDLSGITAGHSTAPAGLGQDRYFSIRMRVRQVGNPLSEVIAGVCEKVAIYNRRYDNVSHGGSWAPHSDSDQLGVDMVNILEIGSGCAEITTSLTVEYTAAHPNLGSVGLVMIGPGGPYSFTFVDDGGATPQNRFGHATPNFNVAALADCAYLVKLNVQLLLTTGDAVPDLLLDEIAFCKKGG